MLELRDRVRGCLLAGACGDALGAPVEFLSYAEIKRRYGMAGIADLDEAYGLVGAITDDTQMTLFTVEGLIRAYVRQQLKGICHVPSVVFNAYRRWLATQDGSYNDISGNVDLDGWLIRERRLWSERAPGLTCLASLRSRSGSNNSKGCGTVMRDAPFGFLGSSSMTLAAETARTTHGHPSARFSSAALSCMIGNLARGTTMTEAVEVAVQTLAPEGDATEVRDALVQALRLARQPDWRSRLPELGAGWVAEEALAISVLCAIAGSSPEDAIVTAVNHDGDSDSTGAITGNLVGTAHGPAALPGRWLEAVELTDVIETLAADFAAVLEGRADAEELWDRYPGH